MELHISEVPVCALIDSCAVGQECPIVNQEHVGRAQVTALRSSAVHSVEGSLGKSASNSLQRVALDCRSG